MRRLQRWLDWGSTTVAGVLIGVFMIIMILNVFSRYALGTGIVWYMESAQFLNVWAMFIGGIGLCVTNDHLRVTIVEEALKGRLKSFFRLLVSLLIIVFYGFLAYSSYYLALRSRQTISTMQSLKMSYVYWLLPFASVLSGLAVVVDVINFLLGNGPETTDDPLPAE